MHMEVEEVEGVDAWRCGELVVGGRGGEESERVVRGGEKRRERERS